MGEPVQLWVYDLSRGMAATMSRQLTGQQIDGVWHTSVVLYGMEIFYGQGISIVAPGTSHHGSPLKKLPMGSTLLDKDTVISYIEGIRTVYRAEAYHLLDFNCNNFTNDVVGFTTGNSIPQDIIDLPKIFLSTPLGQQLLPMITNVFGQGNGSSVQPGSAASQTLQNEFSVSRVSKNSMTSALTICSNMASLNSIFESNMCSVIMFTSETCPPCKTIKPVFEDLAIQYSTTNSNSKNSDQLSQQGSRALPSQIRKIAFVIVDAMAGNTIFSHFGVRATPSFRFFKGNKEVNEVKGANVGELKFQVQSLLHDVYPPHPHSKRSFPALEAVSRDPVIFDSSPNFDTVLQKIDEFISPLDASQREKINVTPTQIIPLLKKKTSKKLYISDALMQEWFQSSIFTLEALEPSKAFPFVDILRIGLLDPSVADRLARSVPITRKLITHGGQLADSEDLFPKPLLITYIRMLANAIFTPSLAEIITLEAFSSSNDINTMKILIRGLLDKDTSVRTSGASLAYNYARFVGGHRVTWLNSDYRESEEWACEIASALIECLHNETATGVAHRLVAALGCLSYLSPHHDILISISEALQLISILRKLRDTKFESDSAKQRLVDEVITLYSGTV